MDRGSNTIQYRCAGGVDYELARRRVKNLNLHVRADGTVAVSVPPQTTLREADAFVAAHAEWIGQAQERQRRRQERQSLLPLPDPGTARAHFTALSDQVYPAFARLLGEKPAVRVRDMTSRWGGLRPGEKTDHLCAPAVQYAACSPDLCGGARVLPFSCAQPQPGLLGRGGAAAAGLEGPPRPPQTIKPTEEETTQEENTLAE